MAFVGLFVFLIFNLLMGVFPIVIVFVIGYSIFKKNGLIKPNKPNMTNTEAPRKDIVGNWLANKEKERTSSESSSKDGVIRYSDIMKEQNK